ncbi:MAG: citrate synthase, partial [Deltaproteobacteria bacterium]|nr:citrate synthase [Deltaproteobacteria bacterium]
MVLKQGDKPTYSRGLEGVIADESKICFIDGQKGELYYRGYSIESLKNCTFAEVTYLLLFAELPTQSQLDIFTHRLREKRFLPRFVIDIIQALPRSAHPMEVLQTCVAALGTDHNGENKIEEKVLTLIAQCPLIVASFYRAKNNQEIVEPSKEFNEGGHFLYLLGLNPSEEESRILETCFILHMEHGFNASTFAARAIGSTLAPYHSAMAGAVGSLFGPLH